ncbi:MAG: hypothetical protein WD230_02595, partial [Cucumibacter sp.]
GATEVAPVALEAVTRAAFGQRRKMLRQSLKALGQPVEPLLAAAGLKGTERAEDVAVAQFVEMAWLIVQAPPTSQIKSI